MPLSLNSLAALLQFVDCPQSDLELLGLEHLQNALAHGLIDQISLNGNAVLQVNGVLMASGTFVGGINSSVALVARRKPAATTTAQHQALEQRPTFASDVSQQLFGFVGLVLPQNLLVLKILLPTDVSAMMVLDQHRPRIDRLLVDPGLDLAVGREGFARPESAENIGSRVGRIIEQRQHAARYRFPSQSRHRLQLAPERR